MPQIIGQLIKAQFENITGNPASALAIGRVWCDVTTPSAGLMKFYDGTQTQQFMTTVGGFAGGTAVTDGSSNTLWLDDPATIMNIGVKTAVAANALTITIQTKALAAPSASAPVYIPFRVATSATGQYVMRAVTSALTIVIPNLATLGNLTSASAQYIYLCAIDNAGTVELAVVGSRYDLDEGSVISTTAISGAATSYTVMYSTNARSNVAFRVLARLRSTQALAGAWVTNCDEISLATAGSRTWPEGSAWKSDLTWTFNNCGTTTLQNFFYRRNRDTMEVRFAVTVGVTAASVASLTLPTGYAIDTAKLPTNPSGCKLGYMHDVGGAGGALFSSSLVANAFYDGASSTAIFFAYLSGSSTYVKSNASALWNSNEQLQGDFSLPVGHWRSY